MVLRLQTILYQTVLQTRSVNEVYHLSENYKEHDKEQDTLECQNLWIFITTLGGIGLKKKAPLSQPIKRKPFSRASRQLQLQLLIGSLD